MTPIEMMYRPTVKAQAKRDYAQYAADLDRLSGDMLIVGDVPMASWAAECAEIAERAYTAERDDPEPA